MTDPRELIGRDRERAALEHAIAATRGGAGGLILLAGEAGAGKTSLARAVLADSQLLVLSGAASQEGSAPYGPLAGALRSYLRRDPAGLACCGPLSAFLALLLPELGPPPGAADQPTLAEALRSAFATIARCQPTAVFLDDLHWADTATLDLLPALAVALAHEPLLLIVSYRSDEIPRGHPLRRMRANLRRAGLLREVTVEPLDVAGSAALAERVLGAAVSPSLAATLFDRTQGLPFFLEELAASLMSSGQLHAGALGLALAEAENLSIPETIRDAVLLRLDDVPEETRRALEVAALLGNEFDLDLLVELCGDDSGIADALEHGLVRDLGAGQCSFRHALMREALYGEVFWTRRRQLHREIAARLEARKAQPALIAEHWLAGREPDRARRALLDAAAAAFGVHAYRDALAAVRRALELWPDGEDESSRLDTLDRLGQCAQLSGELPEAARAWREVADGRRIAGDSAGYAAAERRLAAVYELQGMSERALTARLAAADAFAAIGLWNEAAAERLAAATHLRRARNAGAALECVEHAMEEADHADRVDLQVRARGLRGMALADQGNTMLAVEELRRALSLALEADLVGPAADIYLQLGAVLNQAADYSGARDAFLVGFDYCRARGIPQVAATCLACFAGTLERTGEWPRAIQVCEDLLGANDTAADMRVVAASVLGMICAWRGDAKRARALTTEAATLSRRLDDRLVLVYSAWTRAYLDEQEGRAADAAARYRQVLDQWPAITDRYLMVRPLRSVITCFAIQGKADETRACAKALADIAATVGNPEALAGLAHALGELALLEGDAARAAQQFDQAAELLRDIAMPFDCALVQLRAGLAYAAAGQQQLAVTRLSSAYFTARKLQAQPVAHHAAQELAALGEAVEQRLGRKAARHGDAERLSRREHEVLRCMAVGRSNREIAQELFLSPRTVEMHVGSILAKLGCRSRAEAIHKASEHGLLN